MAMRRLGFEEVKQIAEKYGLRPSRIKGTNVVNIRKHSNQKMEDIAWPDFERILQERGLAVFKAETSDFLKIMKDR